MSDEKISALAEFGRQCFRLATEDQQDLEWDTVFGIATDTGLLQPERRDEPCDGEGGHCECGDVGVDFPTTCYRPADAVVPLLFKDLQAAQRQSGKAIAQVVGRMQRDSRGRHPSAVINSEGRKLPDGAALYSIPIPEHEL